MLRLPWPLLELSTLLLGRVVGVRISRWTCTWLDGQAGRVTMYLCSARRSDPIRLGESSAGMKLHTSKVFFVPQLRLPAGPCMPAQPAQQGTSTRRA